MTSMNAGIGQKSNDTYLNKEDSQVLNGIAILLMVFHHLFSVNNTTISLLVSPDVLKRMAWNGKICVAIYSFISGYAFSKASENWVETQTLRRLRKGYQFTLSRLLKFYKKFWLVFLVYVSIGVLFFKTDVDLKKLLGGCFLEKTLRPLVVY